MTSKDFRRIALGMRGAVEGEHMAHPDFRANGRIFATLSPDQEWGMVKLTPEQQQEFVRAEPATFVPAKGAWGRGGSTMVRLASAGRETVGEAMTLAWQDTVKAMRTKTARTAKKGRR
jgi:YjbR